MKTILKNSVSVLLTMFLLTSCEKENLEKSLENQPSTVTTNSLSEWDAGEEHNAILAAYYENHTVEDEAPLSERIEFVHDYIQAIHSGASFENFLDSNANLVACLNIIDEADPTIQAAQDFIDSLYSNSLMTYYVHANNTSLLNILLDVSDVNATISSINTLMDEIAGDSNISNHEKELLKGVCQVAKASVVYWSDESFKTQGATPWYVKDTMAAMAATRVGLVGYGAMVAGPWGGLGVLVGCAAVGSCIP